MQSYSRAARFFEVDVCYDSKNDHTVLVYRECNEKVEQALTSDGCYLLRTNIKDWTPTDLREAYIHLCDAEESFNIMKNDLDIRPVWHRKDEHIAAHILLCFLGFTVWRAFGQICKRSGLGNEPRRIFEEISKIAMVDVVLKTTNGNELCIRTNTRPDAHQRELLHRLGWQLPKIVEKR